MSHELHSKLSSLLFNLNLNTPSANTSDQDVKFCLLNCKKLSQLISTKTTENTENQEKVLMYTLVWSSANDKRRYLTPDYFT